MLLYNKYTFVIFLFYDCCTWYFITKLHLGITFYINNIKTRSIHMFCRYFYRYSPLTKREHIVNKFYFFYSIIRFFFFF